MRYVQKVLSYTRKHIDYLIVDIVTYLLAYYVAVQIRRSMSIPIHHGELFLKFGLVGLLIYVVVELYNQSLNGIIDRSIVREAEAVGVQMLTSWSIYTVVLFLVEEAHEFSRSIYVFTFFVCFFAILFSRTVWKHIVRYSNLEKKLTPRLLIACEASRAQTVLNRLLTGSFENRYKIEAVVVNEKGELDYSDWYPCERGLEHVADYIHDSHVQEAYVELDDPEEEARVFSILLSAGIIIHRSLGESVFDYATQHINDVAGKYVITIEGAQVSVARKAEKLLRQVRKKWKVYRTKRKDKEDRAA